MEFTNENVGERFRFPNGQLKEFLGWDEQDNLSFFDGTNVDEYTEKELSKLILIKE